MTSHQLAYWGSGSRIIISNAYAANAIQSITIDGSPNSGNFVCEPTNGLFGWYHGDPGIRTMEFAYAITTDQGIATAGRAEPLEAAEMLFTKGFYFGGGTNDSIRKMWVNDKFSWQFIAAAGYVMRPSTYRQGDIAWLINEDTAGEFCIQSGTVTPEVWTSGTVYNATGLAGTYVKNSAGKFYRTMNSPGTPSTVEPTHGSGIVTVGGYEWKWLSNQPGIFKRFGAFLGAKSTAVNDPIYSSTQTWTNAATVYQGHLTNITDTASAVASVVAEWQVGGLRKFTIGKQGGFGAFGATPPTAQPTVTGSRGGNAALASLLTALAATGIIVDGTTV